MAATCEAIDLSAGTPTEPFARELLTNAAPLRPAFAHRVRFQDVDAAGVVFYPRILEHFHDAYVELLRAEGEPLERALTERRWAAPLQWCEGHFLRPMRFGDQLETAVVAARLEGDELALGFRTSQVGGKPAALGQTRAVFVDLTSFRRTVPPESVAALFKRLVAAS
jgi:acyl-CoA thioesterase FadM